MNGVSVTTSVIFFAIAFFASLLGVAFFIRWSRRRELFDVPNERSSHSTPTPRGGGLVIAAVCLIGYLIIGVGFGFPISLGYLIGALLIATVSWLDDLYSLPFWARLIVHIGAAVVLVADAGYWSQIFVPLIATDIQLGTVFGLLLTLGWIVWLVNAYNFMDGIDGIAALQALINSIAWAILVCIFNLPSTFMLSGLVGAASAGFLVHNWPPARIFMGDVGSAFLGFTLAAMPLIARSEARVDLPILPFIAVLFVWLFVFDTIFTLVRRLLLRRRVWEAHREHIYQRLIIEGQAHSTVTVIYGAFSAFLCSLALLAAVFSGIYWTLALLSLSTLTLLITYVGVRKKVDVSH